MKTTAPNHKTPQKKHHWKNFFSGDFLLNSKTKVWYPYILYLSLLAFISIWNNKLLNNKQKELREKEKIYQLAVEDIKLHNNYINFGYKNEIRNKALEQGYIKNSHAKYKLVITNREEK